MKLKENNYAFIDGQNLNLSLKELGWKIDYRVRAYLKDQYRIGGPSYSLALLKKMPNFIRRSQTPVSPVYKPTVVHNESLKEIATQNSFCKQ